MNPKILFLPEYRRTKARRIVVWLSALFVVLAVRADERAASRGAGLAVVRLRCEYLENPLGIDTLHPLLSWALESSARGERQTAFRIVVTAIP